MEVVIDVIDNCLDVAIGGVFALYDLNFSLPTAVRSLTSLPCVLRV